MKKSRGIAAAAAVGIVGALTLAVGPAAAAPVPVTDTPCTDEFICFYQNQFFGGSVQRENLYDDDGRPCHNMTSTLNNRTTAISNFTGFQLYVYDASNCSGTPMATIYALTANDNIGRANNDRISSFRIR